MTLMMPKAEAEILEKRAEIVRRLEAIVAPMSYAGMPDGLGSLYRRLRSPEGERMVLEDNMFVERFQFAQSVHGLSEEVKEAKRRKEEEEAKVGVFKTLVTFQDDSDEPCRKRLENRRQNT